MFVIRHLAAISVSGFPDHCSVTTRTGRESGKKKWVPRDRGRFPSSRQRKNFLNLLKGHWVDDRRPKGLGCFDLALHAKSPDPDVSRVRQNVSEVLDGKMPESGSVTSLTFPSDRKAIGIEPFRGLRKTSLIEKSTEALLHEFGLRFINGQKTRLAGDELISDREYSAVIESTLGSCSKIRGNALRNLLPLELSDVRERVKDHFSGCRGRIKVLPEAHKRAAVLLHEFPNGRKILDRSGKPRKLGDQNERDFFPRNRGQEALKGGSVGIFSRFGAIDEDMRYFPERPIQVLKLNGLADSFFLVFDRAFGVLGLLFGADADVRGDFWVFVFLVSMAFSPPERLFTRDRDRPGLGFDWIKTDLTAFTELANPFVNDSRYVFKSSLVFLLGNCLETDFQNPGFPFGFHSLVSLLLLISPLQNYPGILFN